MIRPCAALAACLAVFAMPLHAQPSGAACQLGLRTGSSIADSQIDGNISSGWNDADLLESGHPCLNLLFDWDGVSMAGTHALPSIPRTVSVRSKRDASRLYFAFTVGDATANLTGGAPLTLGEQLVLQIDPNGSRGSQLGAGPGTQAFDYRLIVRHRRSSPPDLVEWAQSSVDAGSSAYGVRDWGAVSPTPAGVVVGLANTGSGWTVEVAIPLAQIGSPSNDVGISFAIVNDLGYCLADGTCDATGVSFPASLPLTSSGMLVANDPTGAEWRVPNNFGTGYFATAVADATISRSPVFWNSDGIDALNCGGASPTYAYFSGTPCRLNVRARIARTTPAGGSLTRNVLFLWADHGSSPSTWRVIGLNEGVVIPAGGGLTQVNVAEWGGVPSGLANHPCLRVYILPPTYRPGFDRAAILAISNGTELAQMESTYGVSVSHWAQKNMSANPGGVTVCPDGACRVSAAPDAPAARGLSMTIASSVHEAFDWFAPRELHAQQQPQRSRVHLSDEEEKLFASGNGIMQVQAFALTRTTLAPPAYNLLEPIGGLIQLFDIERLRKDRRIPIRFEVSNPLAVPATILLAVDTRVPTSADTLRIALRQRSYDLQAGATTTAQGEAGPGVATDSVPPDSTGGEGGGCGGFGKKEGGVAGAALGLLGVLLRRRRRGTATGSEGDVR